jgi:F0F1-type ATP synthase delta subunit
MTVYAEQLKSPSGSAPTKKEVLENIFGDSDQFTKDAKSWLSDAVATAIEKIKNDFEVDERVTHARDEDDIGTWGTVDVKVTCNRELTDDELEELSEHYQAIGADCYWSDFFEDSFFEFGYEE